MLQICLTMAGIPTSAATSAAAASATSTKQLIVKGGILVFFASYAVMGDIINRWKETNLLDKLRSLVGKVLIEPRSGSGSGGSHSNGKFFNSNSGNRNNDTLIL